jgi:AcrR family transcriptional regulator
MRTVATELGVTPMAVYYYVTDKDELMRLVVERVLGALKLLELDPDEDWRETLGNYMIDIWEHLRRYPGLSSYIINQPALGVTPQRLEAGIFFFEGAGFSSAQARLAWSFAMTYIHGRISVDAHLGRKPAAPHLGRPKARDYVAFGVDAVISGLEAMCDGRPMSEQLVPLAATASKLQTTEA